MRGHIYKRSQSSWTIVFDIGPDPETGKRRQKFRAVKGTRRDAERELASTLHELATGTRVETTEMTVREFLARWLADYASANVSPRTYERYEIVVRRHLVPRLGAIRLRELKPSHIIAAHTFWRESGRTDGNGGLSAQSCLHNHRILRGALGHAVKWQMMATNPADVVDAPRVRRREVTALDAEQVKELLSRATDDDLGNLVHLAVFTGLRRGELLGLRWGDVDLTARTIHVQQTVYKLTGKDFVFNQPKTPRSRRTVALAPSAVAAIRRQRAKVAELRLLIGPDYFDHDLVFPAVNGRPIDQNNFNRRWGKFLKSAGLPHITFHTLRHTFASLLLRAGVHPKVVQEALGHSSIAVTMDTYSHLMPQMQREAIDLLESALGA